LEEVYDDHFVYKKVARQGNSATSYYKVPYSLGENGELNVNMDDVAQVSKNVSYDAISNNSDKGENNMARKDAGTENECPECKKLVNSLIANEHTQWQEQDRSFLEEMDLDSLKKFDPIINKEPEKEEPTETVVNKEPEKKDPPKPVTAQEYVDNSPPEVREVLNAAMRIHKEKKNGLIEQILANARNKFTKEALQAKPLDEIENLAAIAVPVDYSGQGGSVTENEQKAPEALEMPTLNYSDEK
jgi:hypothetical protein